MSTAAPRTKVGAVHKDLMHEAERTALKLPIARLLEKYKSTSGAPSALIAVHLAPNAAKTARGSLTGYVAAIAGTAPAAGIVAESLGTGTTWFRVKHADGHAIDDTELERSFEPVDAAALAGKRVQVVTGLEYPEYVHYLVVHGNAERDAATLVGDVLASGASVADVVDGALADRYKSLLAASQESRVRAAETFMRAHKLVRVSEADGAEPVAHAHSDFLVKSEALTDAATAAAAAEGRHDAKPVYLAYSNVYDCANSQAGVAVWRGPVAGYMLFAAPPTAIKTTTSRAWSNAAPTSRTERSARHFSMMPADTGVYTGAPGRTPDRHKGTSAVIANVAARRVKWSGAVRSYNPASEVVMHAAEDAHVLHALAELGAAPGSPVKAKIYEAVVTQLPALETANMSLGALVDVAAKARETTLPVDTNSLLRMLSAWPAAANYTLAELFAKTSGAVTPTPVSLLRAIAAHTSTSKASAERRAGSPADVQHPVLSGADELLARDAAAEEEAAGAAEEAAAAAEAAAKNDANLSFDAPALGDDDDDGAAAYTQQRQSASVEAAYA